MDVESRSTPTRGYTISSFPRIFSARTTAYSSLTIFLANGAALSGLIELVEQSGATLVGCGICIEKAFQPGGDMLRSKGVRVESLARVKSMSEGKTASSSADGAFLQFHICRYKSNDMVLKSLPGRRKWPDYRRGQSSVSSALFFRSFAGGR